MPCPEPGNSRRDFLTGRSLADRVQQQVASAAQRTPPKSGHTIRMTQRAMACEFAVIMNAGVPSDRVMQASDALDVVTQIDEELSAYRDDSVLSQLNREAFEAPIPVDNRVARVLRTAAQLHQQTAGAYDATAGPLVRLWRMCRAEHRLPTDEEIQSHLELVGMQHVEISGSDFESTDDAEDSPEIRYLRPGIELNLGGIGKGFALDEAARGLRTAELDAWLLHGGRSSLLASGPHAGNAGWPVGIGNPLLPGKRLGTVLLVNQALGTSGSNIQFFRHQGRKYGHILDPRSGWPVESMLSVTVLAPTAAVADALSTAFYVMGVEKAAECCDNLPGVGAILIPLPSGKQLKPIIVGIPADQVFLDPTQLG